MVQGKYLIAADGSKGTMAKKLGLNQRKYQMAGALEVEPRLEVPEDPIIYFDLGLIKQGYVWNFPKADGYSIGGGVLFTGQQGKQNLRHLVADYATEFEVDTSPVKHFGHSIFLWDGHHPPHTHRAVLAGEAACVVDPFTAEGIRPSMFSGGLKASQAVDQALRGDDQALARYTEVMQTEWGEENALGAAVWPRWFIGHRPWPTKVGGLSVPSSTNDYVENLLRPVAPTRMQPIGPSNG